MGDIATGLSVGFIIWSFEPGLPSRNAMACHPFIGSGSDIIRLANVRVLAEALLGADRQEPLVGVSISVCVSLAVHIDRDLNERGWP